MSADRDLRPTGPLSGLDRAISIARASVGDVCVPAWTGGALVAAVVLAIYYVERVEGIRSLRLPMALLLVLAWWWRALLVGRGARRAAATLWDARPPEGAGRAVDVLRTSIVGGLGLWVWSWLLVAGSLAGVIGVLLVLPLFSLRGAVAPSWLARAACEPEAGWRGFFRAVADNHGRRFAGVLVEAMLLAGALGLTINLYALTGIALLLARSFVGIDVASVETFLSPDNTFVMLVVAATAFVVLEPVRASLSALAYVDARVRGEGLDLRAAIEGAIEHSSRRPGAAREAARAALIALAIVFAAQPALAQEPPPVFPAPGMEGEPVSAPMSFDPAAQPASPVLAGDDRDIDERVDRILQRSEFREFEDQRGKGLRDLIERLLEWLFRPREDEPASEPADFGSIPLPGAWFFIVVGALLLISVATYLFLTRRKEQEANRAVESAANVAGDPRDRAPAAFLDDAARLAELGDLREALRALYLATLVALDRRRLIAFDPHLTNWQYLRHMPRGAARDAFAQFTRLFDHKWYGLEETTHEDYERCRALAAEIVASDRAEAAA